jgi:bifunctional UDP-N-acetylglucosamine pyrophosphorylase/glucosamine-1-phosphate N-acetyltransferase
VHVDFLLTYGDLYVDDDVIEQILKFHKRESPTATVAVTPVRNPENYGIVKTSNSRFIEIVEKPKPGEEPTNLANTGIYVFSREIFKKIKEIGRSVRGEFEITDALTLLAREGRVLTFEIPSGRWLDVGRPWDLLEVNRRVLDRMKLKVCGEVEEDARVSGSVMISEGSCIGSGACVEGPSFIGRGSYIASNCYIGPYTSIGRDVKIGKGCKIRECVIFDKAIIGKLSSIEDSIVGENCRLGSKTVVSNKPREGTSVKMVVKDEIVDTGRKRLGAVFGDQTVVGNNVLFMSGVKVGSNSRVSGGAVVRKDVPSNTSFSP